VEGVGDGNHDPRSDLWNQSP